MVWSHTLLQTKAKNYEPESSRKDKHTTETSAPLSIEKLDDPMMKIPKGVFKNTFHNRNVRVSLDYSVVEDLAQTPCALWALEVLQSWPLQWDALLATIGSMEFETLMANVNLSNVKLCLPYHVSFSIDVVHGEKTIGKNSNKWRWIHMCNVYFMLESYWISWVSSI